MIDIPEHLRNKRDQRRADVELLTCLVDEAGAFATTLSTGRQVMARRRPTAPSPVHGVTTTTTFSRGLIELLLGLVVVFVPVVAALSDGGRANADSNEDAYLAALYKVAVPGTADQQVSNGYVICKALDSHQDVLTVASGVAPRANLTIDWSAYMVGAAIRWLCPAQTWQIHELHDADQTVPGVTSAILGYGE